MELPRSATLMEALAGAHMGRMSGLKWRITVLYAGIRLSSLLPLLAPSSLSLA